MEISSSNKEIEVMNKDSTSPSNKYTKLIRRYGNVVFAERNHAAKFRCAVTQAEMFDAMDGFMRDLILKKRRESRRQGNSSIAIYGSSYDDVTAPLLVEDHEYDDEGGILLITETGGTRHRGGGRAGSMNDLEVDNDEQQQRFRMVPTSSAPSLIDLATSTSFTGPVVSRLRRALSSPRLSSCGNLFGSLALQ